ncbi:MAG: asparaginase domain-containing protein [Gammaproteobacteria bacterium]
MSIRILTTGGTIDKVYFDATSEFEVGEPTAGLILKDSRVTVDYEVTPLMRKDSLELTDEDRAVIAKAATEASESCILITHGTDTMTDTAAVLLAAGIVELGKTVVITGALNPARFRSTDAIFNVGMATAAVQGLDPGVYITMNGQVFPGDKVRKNREKMAFELID